MKVVDFGLAKRSSKAPGPDDATQTAALTAAGAVVGTPQYMSPEQFEGEEASERSDIFGFGCVVYEMVTGRRAFRGKTQASVIAAIMGAEPESMSALQPVIPRALEKLVRRCLAKNPEERYQSMRDVLLELRSIAEEPAEQAAAQATLNRPLWWGAAALLVLIGGGAGWLVRPPEPLPSYRLSVNPPEKTVFLPAGLSVGGSAISPSGTMLAFVARADGKTQLWVRRLDSLAARPLPGTEGAYYPFWSPDSRSVGFFAGDSLKKSEVAGGPPQTLCEVALGRGGSWSAEGVILFSAFSTGHTLHRVPASGGTPVAVTVLDTSRGEVSHYWPRFLPDSRHYLYSVGASQAAMGGIRVRALDAAPSRQDKLLLSGVSMVAYAGLVPSGPLGKGSGHLVFLRDRALMAQQFDPAGAQEGDPFLVAEQVSDFSVSANGILAYASGAELSQLVMRDRSGAQLGVVGSPSSVHSPSFSPDGKRLAFSRLDPAFNVDIWVAEVDRGTPSRLTFHPAFDTLPVWSSDGNQIAFSSRADGELSLYRKASSGAGEPERMTEGNNGDLVNLVNDWSANGRFLLFTELGLKTGEDLMILPLTGERKPAVFLKTQFAETFGRFSPDGGWIAYSSNATGIMEIYVQPFLPGRPASGASQRISAAGGVQPRWSGDGKELYYLSPEGKVMAARVIPGAAALQANTPTVLFSTGIQPLPWANWQFDVTRNGQRFILVEPVEETEAKSMTLMINWLAGARR